MATITVALPGQYITPLLEPETLGVTTLRYNIPASVLQVASSTTSGDIVNLTLGTTPSSWVATGAYAVLNTLFNPASVTSITMSLGTTTNAGCFLASTSVSGASNSVIQPSTGVNTVAVVANATATSILTTQAVFTIQGAAGFNAVTSGYMQVFLTIRDLTQMY